MKNKINIVVIILVVILTIAILGLGIYIGLNIKDTTNKNENNINDTSNNQQNDNESETKNEDNNEKEDDNNITIGNYEWKMKVINPNGAKVYRYGAETCDKKSLQDGSLKEGKDCGVVDTLEYGSIIEVGSDYIEYQYASTLSKGKEYSYDDIKENYYVSININGSIRVTDLELIEDSINFNNFTKIKDCEYCALKNYVNNDYTYLYEGPGLVFDKIKKIPKGEIVEAEYSSGRWRYVKYGDTKGWVLTESFHSTDNPYQFAFGDVLDIEEQSGTLKLNKSINLYNNTNMNDKDIITTLSKNTEIKYDYYVVSDIAEYKLHVNYNGTKGWILVYESDCININNNDSKFIEVELINENNSIKVCE